MIKNLVAEFFQRLQLMRDFITRADFLRFPEAGVKPEALEPCAEAGGQGLTACGEGRAAFIEEPIQERQAQRNCTAPKHALQDTAAAG